MRVPQVNAAVAGVRDAVSLIDTISQNPTENPHQIIVGSATATTFIPRVDDESEIIPSPFLVNATRIDTQVCTGNIDPRIKFRK